MRTSYYSPTFFIKHIVLAILATICTLQPGKAQMSVKLANALSMQLEQKAEEYKIPGLAAAVVFPDGSVWKNAVGYAGKKELTADMLFEMGSNTKTFTAALIFLLEEEGKLSIEDTIYKFISPIKHVPYGLSIRQMLNHTSGLFNFTDHPNFNDSVNKPEQAKWDVDSMLKVFMGAPLSAPGSRYEYCNTGTILLGKIIEAIEKKPYHQVLRTRILDKFNLTNTYLDVYEPYTTFKAEAWLYSGRYLNTRLTSFLSMAWAAGAIISTPDDLAKWANLLYSGKVINATSLAKMTSKVKIGPVTYQAGLGLLHSSHKGYNYWGHGGTTLQNSEMSYSIKRKFSCVTVSLQQGSFTETRNIQNSFLEVLESEVSKLLATESAEASVFSVYPNPANGSFTVNVENFLENTEVKIYNTSGQLVASYPLTEASLQIFKENIGTGVFVAELHNGNTVLRQKVVLY